MRLIQLGAILLFAIALIPGGAHLLEFTNKMKLDRDAYMTVQQIYQGWDLMGIALIAALIVSIVLAFLSRQQRTPFWLALAASGLLMASLAVFFIWTFPANTATANWTVAPQNWMALRQQWEYSHAMGAALVLAALVCVSSSCLAWKEPPD